ncbi:hypothetical protein FHX37_2051 [Haloactinospora alba]|uniref:Uncharacterized protein n=1 Tax=Haloactinospora alba TaxID=405555 RepID=A0A543NJS8_9ACTN|nr:hypothetical protein [Haloactinospora alba]TQN32123.1 hypothetical protein FHX37_2051 [Haloactinospora alba]
MNPAVAALALAGGGTSVTPWIWGVLGLLVGAAIAAVVVSHHRDN